MGVGVSVRSFGSVSTFLPGRAEEEDLKGGGGPCGSQKCCGVPLPHKCALGSPNHHSRTSRTRTFERGGRALREPGALDSNTRPHTCSTHTYRSHEASHGAHNTSLLRRAHFHVANRRFRWGTWGGSDEELGVSSVISMSMLATCNLNGLISELNHIYQP